MGRAAAFPPPCRPHLAGYDGGPAFGSAAGPYTSCGFSTVGVGKPPVFSCTTLTPNRKVNGTVNVVNKGTVTANGGDGIFAFNFGNGNVSVTSSAAITATRGTGQNGIEAFSAEVGNISVTTTANVTGGSGSGIKTTSAGTGTTSISALAGTIQGVTSGVPRRRTVAALRSIIRGRSRTCRASRAPCRS